MDTLANAQLKVEDTQPMRLFDHYEDQMRCLENNLNSVHTHLDRVFGDSPRYASNSAAPQPPTTGRHEVLFQEMQRLNSMAARIVERVQEL